MKVLVWSQHYWPESFRINDVVDSLRRAGCDVSVLTGQPNYPSGRVFEGYAAGGLGSAPHPDGYTIHRVPLWPRGSGSAVPLAANYLSFITSASLFGPWLLRGQRFDVVFVYGTSPILQAIPAILVKALKGAKLVTWVQDLWPQSLVDTGFVRNRAVLAGVGAVVRWIYRRSDLILAQSKSFVATVGAMAGDTPVEYHPNPGEPTPDAAPAGAPAIRLGDKFNVVFAGNLGAVQSLETVLDAAELLRAHGDIQLFLIGSGRRDDWCRSEVGRRGLHNVSLPGRFPAAAMPAILAQASALLVALIRSPQMTQTIPSKLQAYLAAGRPIVASMDGEGAQIVCAAGAGLARPAEDARGLADAIIELRDTSPAERARMGLAGQAYFREHFEPSMLASRLLQRFAALTSR